MAQKSTQKASYRMSYRGFEGVNTLKTHSGDESISLIENFRITDDRSLKKRCGFKKICDAPSDVSQAFRAVRDGKEFYYMISDGSVLKYTPESGSVTTLDEMPQCSSAYFFEHLGSYYLCTDTDIYLVTDEGLASPNLYIPLYGKDWPSSYAGEMHEPVNILCDRVMISYKFGELSHGLLSKGDLKIADVEAVYRNGKALSSDKFYYDDFYDIITVTEHEDTDVFIAIIKIIPDEKTLSQRTELLKSKAASVFYELDRHNLLFWGSSEDNVIYYSKTPSKESLEFSSQFSSSQGELYVPPDSYFTVDKRSDRTKAIIRHYDRVLIMTDSSTWMTDLQELGSDSFKLKSINASLGCARLNGAVRINNSVISLGEDSAFCWTSKTDELNECNAYSISKPIQALLPKGFFKNSLIFLNENDSEVWFHNASLGETWIYNVKQSAWYKYVGFVANTFLESSASVSFVDKKSVYRFDSSLFEDPSGAIKATLKSGELEFNTYKYKKLYKIVFRGEFSSGRLSLKLVIDNEKVVQRDVQPSSKHFILPFRIKTGSFKSISFEISALDAGEQVLHGMKLYAG